MTFVSDLFKGRFGLAKTFWLFGIVLGLILMAGQYGAAYIVIQNLDKGGVVERLPEIYTVFLVAWFLFITIAIINSSTFNRARRGFWGWLACVVAVLWLANAAFSGMQVLGVVDHSWRSIEKLIVRENLLLPAEIEPGIILEKMTANESDRSITYTLRLDEETVGEDLDHAAMKAEMLQGCADLEMFFSGSVDLVLFEYIARDDSFVSVEILSSDCGYP